MPNITQTILKCETPFMYSYNNWYLFFFSELATCALMQTQGDRGFHWTGCRVKFGESKTYPFSHNGSVYLFKAPTAQTDLWMHSLSKNLIRKIHKNKVLAIKNAKHKHEVPYRKRKYWICS